MVLSIVQGYHLESNNQCLFIEARDHVKAQKICSHTSNYGFTRTTNQNVGTIEHEIKMERLTELDGWIPGAL